MCRGDTRLLQRAAHGCVLHPVIPNALLIFGGYGIDSTSASEKYQWLHDLVVLKTDRSVQLLPSLLLQHRTLSHAIPIPASLHPILLIAQPGAVFFTLALGDIFLCAAPCAVWNCTRNNPEASHPQSEATTASTPSVDAALSSAGAPHQRSCLLEPTSYMSMMLQPSGGCPLCCFPMPRSHAPITGVSWWAATSC